VTDHTNNNRAKAESCELTSSDDKLLKILEFSQKM